MNQFMPLIEKVSELKNVRERRWGRYAEMALKLLNVVGYDIEVCIREKKLNRLSFYEMPSFVDYFNHERLRYMDIQVSKFYLDGQKKQASFISRIASDADSGCFTSLAMFLKSIHHMAEWRVVDKTMFHPNRWTFGTGMYWYHISTGDKAAKFKQLHNSHSTASYTWPIDAVMGHLERSDISLHINGQAIPNNRLRQHIMRMAEDAGLPPKKSGVTDIIGRWFYGDEYKFGPPFEKVIALLNYYHCDIRLLNHKNDLIIDLTKAEGPKAKCRPVHRKLKVF